MLFTLCLTLSHHSPHIAMPRSLVIAWFVYFFFSGWYVHLNSLEFKLFSFLFSVSSRNVLTLGSSLRSFWGTRLAHSRCSFFFFLKKIFVFKPEVYLLRMNKPGFPASSHALLLYEPISWFTCWPGELALPSPACFLGSIALQCPCPSFQFVQVPSAFKVNPLAWNNPQTQMFISGL